MIPDLAAVDAALTTALPALCATAIPALALTALAAAMEWHRLGQDEPDWTFDDYRQPASVRVRQHRPQPVDAPTQVIRRVLPDAGTPLFDQLAARRIAHEVLADLGQRARTGAAA